MRRVVLVMVLAAFAVTMVTAAGQQAKDAGVVEQQTIKVYDGLWENIARQVTNLGETPLYRELEQRTGVKVEWVHPPQGGDREFFNLMLASGDLPDAIYRDWVNGYPGGPEKAIQDDVIIRLNDIMEKNSPNFTGLLKTNPGWNRGARTDSGTLYMFPFIRGHESLLVFFGPALRADWLKELNLEVPVTIDDWTRVLTALKAKTGGLGPLSFTSFASGGRHIKTGPAFISAYGLRMDFFHRDSKVAFGQYEPAYLEFLTLFQKWYADGLIDKEFITNDLAAFNAKVLNHQAAAFVGYTGSTIGVFLDSKKGDPNFDLVAAPYPVLRKGEKPFSGQMDYPVTNNGLVITTKAKDPALVARWADYAYGKEGHMLFNFGLEGESYKMVDGFPAYSEVITKHAGGIATGLGLFTRAVYSGPIVQDKRYIVQYLARAQQRDALDKWFNTDAAKNIMPPVTQTPEESRRLSAIMTEINTYSDEMFVKFIVGDEPLSRFEQYRAQLKRMGIEEAIGLKQAALDRFNKR